MAKKKVLVVYFSATGTTRQVAKQIAKIADADIFEITPAKPYSSADLDWTNKQSRSSVEMNNPKARPEIIALSVDVSKYDYIFLGYPIWWDLAPRTVNTFLDVLRILHMHHAHQGMKRLHPLIVVEILYGIDKKLFHIILLFLKPKSQSLSH